MAGFLLFSAMVCRGLRNITLVTQEHEPRYCQVKVCAQDHSIPQAYGSKLGYEYSSPLVTGCRGLVKCPFFICLLHIPYVTTASVSLCYHSTIHCNNLVSEVGRLDHPTDRIRNLLRAAKTSHRHLCESMLARFFASVSYFIGEPTLLKLLCGSGKHRGALDKGWRNAIHCDALVAVGLREPVDETVEG